MYIIVFIIKLIWKIDLNYFVLKKLILFPFLHEFLMFVNLTSLYYFVCNNQNSYYSCIINILHNLLSLFVVFSFWSLLYFVYKIVTFYLLIYLYISQDELYFFMNVNCQTVYIDWIFFRKLILVQRVVYS